MPALQPSYLVEAVYAPDAADRRTPFREEHLAGLSAHVAAGTLLTAGAFDDMSGSVLIALIDDEDEILRLVHNDIYWRNGVWVDVRLRRFHRLVS
jgi:uncharacterized protein YciI